jgi:hypothetical protein
MGWNAAGGLHANREAREPLPRRGVRQGESEQCLSIAAMSDEAHWSVG